MQQLKRLGLTTQQLAILGGLALLTICVFCGGGGWIALEMMGAGGPLPTESAGGDVNPDTTPEATPTPALRAPTLPPEWTDTPTVATPTGPATLAAPTRDPNRHYEEAGKFSFIPPDGWQMGELAGLKYQVAVGPVSDEFAPNLNIVDEAFSGALEEYAEANLTVLEQTLTNLNVVDQADFTTDDGAEALKVVLENTQNDRDLRQTLYFFDGPAQKYVMTCTRLADGQTEVDALCDRAAQSFLLEP